MYTVGMNSILGLCLFALMPVAAFAEPPVVTGVGVAHDDMGWEFSVTLRHGDTGWDHYADRWDILAEDGTVLATRTLRHPHVNEQPFTRSLHQVVLPDGTRRVFVRAKCTESDLSTPAVAVDIPL